MDQLGKRLVFLISQPRSGSTLLQHILGGHSAIHTLPEPWFMLHLGYGLRSDGILTAYNARFAHMAVKGFFDRIPGGEEAYFEAARRMGSYLYETALEPSGKRYFLDKTPRYYLIIPELYRIFPDALFIFLIRNPLAVLASIIDVHVRGDCVKLLRVDRRHDVVSAPRLILEGIRELGQRAAVVHYEKLVAAPDVAVRNVCERIGLTFEDAMLNYGAKLRFENTPFVDPKSIYRHSKPVAHYADDWQTKLNTARRVDVARACLELLGEDVVGALGYSYGELAGKLESSGHGSRAGAARWKWRLTEPFTLGARERGRPTLRGLLGRSRLGAALRRGARVVLER